MITKKEVYETTDGRQFDDIKAAEAAQKYIDTLEELRSYYAGIGLKESQMVNRFVKDFNDRLGHAYRRALYDPWACQESSIS